MKYAIYSLGSLIACFEYESDRDVALLALIKGYPDGNYTPGERKGVTFGARREGPLFSRD